MGGGHFPGPVEVLSLGFGIEPEVVSTSEVLEGGIIVVVKIGAILVNHDGWLGSGRSEDWCETEQ